MLLSMPVTFTKSNTIKDDGRSGSVGASGKPGTGTVPAGRPPDGRRIAGQRLAPAVALDPRPTRPPQFCQHVHCRIPAALAAQGAGAEPDHITGRSVARCRQPRIQRPRVRPGLARPASPAPAVPRADTSGRGLHRLETGSRPAHPQRHGCSPQSAARSSALLAAMPASSVVGAGNRQCQDERDGFSGATHLWNDYILFEHPLTATIAFMCRTDCSGETMARCSKP
jgi:hypothetical protein